MRAEPMAIKDVVLLTPKVISDDRGVFCETYHHSRLHELGVLAAFVQDNQSVSLAKHTVRGLHFQARPHAQGKLIRVVRGSIIDIAVDIRDGSPTYGQHVSALLSAENWNQLWVPEGFAHGFCTLEDATDVVYKVTDYYSAEDDRGLYWADPALGISWPVSESEAKLSLKDQRHPTLKELPSFFDYRS